MYGNGWVKWILPVPLLSRLKYTHKMCWHFCCGFIQWCQEENNSEKEQEKADAIEDRIVETFYFMNLSLQMTAPVPVLSCPVPSTPSYIPIHGFPLSVLSKSNSFLSGFCLIYNTAHKGAVCLYCCKKERNL